MMIMKGCGEDSGSAAGDLAPDPRGAADLPRTQAPGDRSLRQAPVRFLKCPELSELS